MAAPPEARDATAPSTILHASIADTERLLAEQKERNLPPATLAALAGTRATVLDALAEYGTSPRPDAALRSLETATRRLWTGAVTGRADVAAILNRLSVELARAARGMTTRLTRRAASAGVPAAVVHDAELLVARADAAIASGAFVTAM